jgi:hypothetical protein
MITDNGNLGSSDSGTKSKADISTYTSPTLVVALTAIIGYALGWAYVESFCQRLGIHHESLDYATVSYWTKSFPAVFLGSIVAVLALYNVEQTEKSFLNALRGNSPCVVFAAVVSYLAFEEYPNLGSWVFALCAVTVAFCAILLTIKKRSFALVLYRMSDVALYAAVGIFLILALLLAVALGRVNAVNTLDGSIENSTTIRLQTKVHIEGLDDGEELILIFNRVGKYFVAKKTGGFYGIPGCLCNPRRPGELCANS